MKPIRVQLMRRKGWKMPPNTVKVDRTTPWGNPFKVGAHGTQEYCVQLHCYLMCGLICMGTNNVNAQKAYNRYVAKNHPKLKGRNLACWCPLDKPCHADALLELANRKPPCPPRA